MATPVEQIKERLSIVDVVSSYVQLHKAGKNLKGKSPFTNEKTPSFFVSPDRGVYYCFSSGKGGDIFSFIEEMEGVDFKGALKILAERAHVELVPENPKKRTERETLYAIIEMAAQFFEETLRSRPEVGAYLKERGVTPPSIAKWRIGYVDDEWRSLRDHLAKKGFSDELILRSGLIKRVEEGNSLYDVFRGRVMFPIADSSGRIVAFSGRTLSKDPALPKYVNSPETELYQKSHILFGYHLAKQSIRTHNFSLIVEGQFDLVLAHQAGFGNTVAISGTALSEHHAALLERLSKRVVLALDADRAGVNSVKRSAHLMLARGMDVKVAQLVGGKDPADLVREDPAHLKRAVREAVTVIEFLIAHARETARDERAFKLIVRDDVLPFIARIPDRIDREHFETVVSTAIGTTKDAIHYEVERILQHGDTATEDVSAPHVDAEKETPTAPHRTEELVKHIYGTLAFLDSEPEHGRDIEGLRSEFREAIGEDAWRALKDGGDEEKLVFEAELAHAETPRSAIISHVRVSLREIRTRMLRVTLADARAKLKVAEASGDHDRSEEYLALCAELQKKLSALGDDGV